jgi:hypothetical protein
MNHTVSQNDLKAACLALQFIREHGDESELLIWLAARRQEWKRRQTIGRELHAKMLGADLSKLTGLPREQCEQAALSAFAESLPAAMVDEVRSYARHLYKQQRPGRRGAA